MGLHSCRQGTQSIHPRHIDPKAAHPLDQYFLQFAIEPVASVAVTLDSPKMWLPAMTWAASKWRKRISWCSCLTSAAG